MFNIAAIQMNTANVLEANLQEAAELVASAAQDGAKLVALPEDFAYRGADLPERLAMAELPGSGKIQDFLANLAHKHGIFLVGGTIPLKSAIPNKSYSSSLFFASDGKCLARYDKIHLFDVTLPERGQVYVESDHTVAGSEVVVAPTSLGNIGLSICYDLRFPELYRQMMQQKVDIIVLPASFTVPTGKAHWEVLLRARAIENLAYVAASAQCGTHLGGRDTYGHSMIVEPWGSISSLCQDPRGYCLAEVDLNKIKHLRETFPVLTHQKLK